MGFGNILRSTNEEKITKEKEKHGQSFPGSKEQDLIPQHKLSFKLKNFKLYPLGPRA